MVRMHGSRSFVREHNNFTLTWSAIIKKVTKILRKEYEERGFRN